MTEPKQGAKRAEKEKAPSPKEESQKASPKDGPPPLPAPKDDAEKARLQSEQLQRRARATKEAERAVATKPSGFVVAPRKSITSHRGILTAGAPVAARDFVKSAEDEEQGEERILELAEKGYLVQKGG